ncbi:MAG: PilZ domain-containing protein, partial [Candidatus Omnitrophica bacterium]|nr:PilZ domain-containing protein [Candidatus Omnitrophota bacterium]
KSKFEIIKEMISSDKRLCERLRLPIKVYYSEGLTKDITEWIGPVLLDNASGNGLMFHCDKDIPKGKKLNIRLFIEDDLKPIDFDGEVIWARQKNCLANMEKGLGFLYGVFIKEKDIKEYQRFVTYITDSIIDEYLDERGKLREE